MKKTNIIYINLQLRSRAVPAQEAPNLASLPDFVLSNILAVLARVSLSLLISSLSDISPPATSTLTLPGDKVERAHQLAGCQTVTVYTKH